MKPNEAAALLCGSRQQYESTLATVAQFENATDLLNAVLHQLDTSELPNVERERRLTAIYSRATIDNVGLTLVARSAAALENRVLRNAVTQLLPAQLRQLVRQPLVAAGTETLDLPSATATAAESDQGPALDADAVAPLAYSDVLILSLNEDPATTKLLHASRFVPLRVETLEALDLALTAEPNAQICAILVERSFLDPLDPEQQSQLLATLAQFSTFTFIRIEEDGLKLSSSDATSLMGKARCRVSSLEVTELQFRERPGLQHRELDNLNNARRNLSTGQPGGLFVPGELSWNELILLGAAMSRYSKRKHFDAGAELSSVKTRFLLGGATGARVAVVKLNDLRFPVVVKVAGKEQVLDEARRFFTFIYKDDASINPEVHLHANAALIIFDVIPVSEQDVEQPAPTLEDLLVNLWYGEMRGEYDSAEETRLLKAFTSAVDRLAVLNMRSCEDQGFKCLANPYVAGILAMEQSGFDWRLGREREQSRQNAMSVLREAEHIATCHGDAHSRNVLVRGDQGFLIDYALSGPGHPCADLVKLELSVYFGLFQPFALDDALILLQGDLTRGDDAVTLLSSHAQTINSRSNALCIKLCVIARDKVLKVLETHKLDLHHYESIKLLTAWQSLQVPRLEQGLVRSVIAALSKPTA